MTALKSLRSSHFRFSAPRLEGALKATAGAFLACVALGTIAPDLAAQARQDQVSYVDRRGRPQVARGVLKSNTLEATVIEVDGSDETIASADVRGVQLGDVPAAYADGVGYFEVRDYENAAAKLSAVATDGSNRGTIRASARLLAARAWLKRGGDDAAAFTEAISQLERFLSDHADHRDVPHARSLHGRAQWLAGDPAAAAETFGALYTEAQGSTAPAGYGLGICYEAGLSAAQCLLLTGDVDGARTKFSELSSAITSALASLDAEDLSRATLETVLVQARLGEGETLLASGSTTQAKTFFQGQMSDAPKSGTQRSAARLGLADVLFAEARYREASIEYAQVSALDHGSRDRVARALVGLAECSLKLSDSQGRQQAKRWLQTVQDQFGDTPSVLRAQKLSEEL